MGKDDPTFCISKELKASSGSSSENPRKELGEEEYRRNLMKRTMQVLSISEQFTEVLSSRLNTDIVHLKESRPSAEPENVNFLVNGRVSTKRKAADSSSDSKCGKIVKRNDGSRQPSKTINYDSQLQKISNRQPKLLEGAIMRDYQLDGLDWLVALDVSGANGILADEMGLGKTIQVISLICFLVEVGVGRESPFLVIGPLSTLNNWVMEFKKFAPQIPVILYHGKKEDRLHLRKKIKQIQTFGKYISFPVVITSYEMPLKDTELRRITWRYLIIDEGHRLKNHQCLLIKELRRYNAANRLLLTGTPLQNNMIELWSLLNFILPNIVYDMDVFESWFDTSTLEESNADEKIVQAEEKDKILTTLHKILKPFLLRRVKADVGLNLPPKKEILVYAPMTEWQHRLYSSVVDKTLRSMQGFQERVDPLDMEKAIRHQTKRALKNSLSDSNSCCQPMVSEGKSPQRSGILRTRSEEKSASISRMISEEALLAESDSLGKTRSSKEESKISMDSPIKKNTATRPLLRAKRRSTVSAGDYKLLANGVPLYSIRVEPLYLQEDSSILESDLESPKSKLLEGLAEPHEEFVTQMKMTNPAVLLRKICSHPYLATFPVLPGTKMLKIDENIVKRSGKMQVLDALLTRLKKNGHKVLLFSNFTQMLDIIEDYLLYKNYTYTRLDGTRSLSDREMNIKKFSSSDTFVFLISTRAGGLGINLVAADTVIIFDSDWNPQVDLQAQDRCHRIGQTKPVAVYRLVVRGTIDEEILKRAEKKKQLDKLVIQHGKFKNVKLNEVVSIQELRQLLQAQESHEVAADRNLVYNEEELDLLCNRTEFFVLPNENKFTPLHSTLNEKEANVTTQSYENKDDISVCSYQESDKNSIINEIEASQISPAPNSLDHGELSIASCVESFDSRSICSTKSIDSGISVGSGDDQEL